MTEIRSVTARIWGWGKRWRTKRHKATLEDDGNILSRLKWWYVTVEVYPELMELYTLKSLHCV